MAEKYYFSQKTISNKSAKKWKKSDFDYANVELIYRNDFPMLDYLNDGKKPERYIFYFSDVIRYSDDYYLFTVMQGTTHFLSLSTPAVVVVQKKNEKWSVVQQISDYR